MFFNDNMRELREKSGLSQVELAKKVGIPFQTINRYENTDIMPRISVIVKIAQALDVTINELLGLSEYPNPQSLIKEWELILKPNFFLGYDESTDTVEIVALATDRPIQMPYNEFALKIAGMKEEATQEIKIAFDALLYKKFSSLMNQYESLRKMDELMKSGKSFEEAYYSLNELENKTTKD